MKRNITLDCARGFLMLVVVFGHALQKCNGMSTTDPVSAFILLFQMRAFMFVSGFATAYSSSASPFKVISSRTKRLVVPYLLWVLAMWFCCHGLSMDGLTHEVLTSQFWFLRILFLIFVAYAGALLFHVRGIVACITFVVIAGTLRFVPGQGSVFHYALFFALGYFANKLSQRMMHVRTEVEKSMGLGRKVLLWVGTNSLAIYAVHWNLLYAHFPYDKLHLSWILNNSAHLYVRSAVVFTLWMMITAILIFEYTSITQWKCFKKCIAK